MTEHESSLLLDHVDMRMVAVDTDEPTADRNTIVQLDPDHPGFRDQEYRKRRNQIAQLALSYQPGQTIPDAPYTLDEHRVWQTIWTVLRPAQQQHACAEYVLHSASLDPALYARAGRGPRNRRARSNSNLLNW